MIPQQHRLERALEAAQFGFKVFPVYSFLHGKCTCCNAQCSSPGKHPILKDWQNLATANDEQVRAFWEKTPLANIGILCQGLFVLDVDSRHGGEESLEQLVLQHGTAWLETVQSCTGGGGKHIFFKLPPNAAAKNAVGFMPGLDVRTGGNAFVVAPGSVHKSGNLYSWDKDHHPSRVPIATAPAWLIELASRKQQVQTPASGESDSETIPEGRRNDTLFKLACTLRDTLAAEDLRTFLHFYNNKRCDPPLPAQEVESIVQSATSKQAVRKLKPMALAADPVAKWRWKDHLAFGQLHILAGRGGVGKSTIATDFAFRIATGAAFAGEEGEHEPRSIVWVAADTEAEGIVKARCFAAGVPPARAFIQGELQLPGGVQQLKQEIKELQPECPVGLVVVDCLAACLPSKLDINSLTDVNFALAPLQELAEDLEAAVVVIHHLNKSPSTDYSTRLSGSDGIRNAARLVLMVIEQNGARLLGVDKNSYGQIPPCIKFEIKPVCVRTQNGVFETGLAEWQEEINQSLSEITPKSAEEFEELSAFAEDVAALAGEGELSAEEIRKKLGLDFNVRRVGQLIREARKLGLFKQLGVEVTGPVQVRRGSSVARCYRVACSKQDIEYATNATCYKTDDDNDTKTADESEVVACSIPPYMHATNATHATNLSNLNTIEENEIKESADGEKKDDVACVAYQKAYATCTTGQQELEQQLDRLAALLIDQIKAKGEYRVLRTSPGYAQVAHYAEEFRKRLAPNYTIAEEKDALVARPTLSASDIDFLKDSEALWDTPHFLAKQLKVPVAAVQNAITALKGDK
jgi:hypothetical protein